MARRVTTAPQAAAAFQQARAWLMQAGSGPNGAHRWDNLRDSRKRLRAHPYLGKSSDEHPGHYQLVASGYRILYRIEDPDTGDNATAGDVRVVALFGPGQP